MKNIITPEEMDSIYSICKEYKIYNYKINKDLSIDVNGSVDISDRYLREFPIKFRNVSGAFDCSRNKLTSLIGGPVKVGESFSCDQNKLTSLEHCPVEVGYTFACALNELTNLDFLPKLIGEHLFLQSNQLTSLVGCPEIIKGSFRCNGNQLLTLIGCPKQINGHFACNDNILTSLFGAPNIVLGDYNYFFNNLPYEFNVVHKLSKDDDFKTFMKYQNYYDVWNPDLDIDNMNELLTEITEGLQ